MRKWGYFLVLLLVLTSYSVVAEIVVSEPLNVYNLNDRLYVEVDGLTGANSGNLNIDLSCEGNITNLVKISARAFSTEDEQSYSIPYKILNKDDLEISNISSILGNCQILTSLGTKSSATKTFLITDEVVVQGFLDKSAYDPGEQISLDISAIKKNGKKLSGFVDVTNVTTFNRAMEDGNLREVFTISETLEAGKYQLDIYAYDMGSNQVLNSGKTSISFLVNQIATSIIVSMSSSKATPGQDFTFGVEVFDQSGIEMKGEADIKIISPNEEVLEFSTEVGELRDIYFENNDTPGIWKIYTTFNNLVQEKELEVIEVQKVNFDLEDSVLIVKNIGNTLYNKSITIQIGNESKVLNLKIPVGDTRKFNLGAPKGEYEVFINDGETSINKQVLLTGNAISVNDLTAKNIFKNYAIFWIFLLLIIGSIGFILLKKHNKVKLSEDEDSENKKKAKFKKKAEFKFREIANLFTRLFHKVVPKKLKSHVNDSLNYTNKSPKVQGLDSSSYHHKDKSMIDLTSKRIKEAESTLVLKGHKHMSSVVSISIKNFTEIDDGAKKSLYKIIDDSQNKGLVDWRSDHAFIVFSPIITKTYHNEILASKVAMEIKENIANHNKKFKDKISFNIGINSGEIVAIKESDKLKYTSIGNTVSFAKRISDSDSDKVLISDSIRKKLLRDIKVEKSKEIGENPTFEIMDIKDRSADAKKLKELIKRMD